VAAPVRTIARPAPPDTPLDMRAASCDGCNLKGLMAYACPPPKNNNRAASPRTIANGELKSNVMSDSSRHASA